MEPAQHETQISVELEQMNEKEGQEEVTIHDTSSSVEISNLEDELHLQSQDDTIFHAQSKPSLLQFYWKMLKAVTRQFIPLGLTSFTGSMGQIQEKFVDTEQWLNNEQFMEIYALAQSLPGPTLSQVVYGLAILKYGWIAGFLSNIFFCGPGFIALLIAGWILQNFSIDPSTSPLWLQNLQIGLACSGIAFAAHSTFKLSENCFKDAFSTLLTVSVCLVTLIYRPMWFLPVLIIIGSVASLFYYSLDAIWSRFLISHQLKKEEPIKTPEKKSFAKKKHSATWKETYLFYKQLILILLGKPHLSTKEAEISTEVTVKKNSLEEKDQHDEHIEMLKEEPLTFPLWTGVVHLLVFIVVFLALFVPSFFFPDVVLLQGMEFFYRMGSLIFGGGVAGIPLIRDELVTVKKYVTDQQFLNGYAICNMLPGPRFNIAAFFGAVMSQSVYLAPIYGLLIGIAFHLPGYLTMCGCFPFLQKIRTNIYIQRMLKGVNSVCMGYVISNTLALYMNIVGIQFLLAFLVVMCFYLLASLQMAAPVVVLGSGITAVVMGTITGSKIVG